MMISSLNPQTADDVCRIISTALLADGDLDGPELLALGRLGIEKALDIPADRFRNVLHEVCKELMAEDSRGPGLSILEPGRIAEAMRMLNEPTHRFSSSARLIELIQELDPQRLQTRLLDPARLNASLDRISDPRVRFWTSAVLLNLVIADDEVHRNEMAVLNHVLDRWNIAPGALRADLERAAA
jgi:hypothetical protein